MVFAARCWDGGGPGLYHRGMRVSAVALLVLTACAPAPKPPAKPEPLTLDVVEPWADPIAGVPQRSTRQTRERAAALSNPAAPAIAIRHATIMTANGQTIANGTIVLEHGAISALGSDANVAVPAGARAIDATGKVVTPGLIHA